MRVHHMLLSKLNSQLIKTCTTCNLEWYLNIALWYWFIGHRWIDFKELHFYPAHAKRKAERNNRFTSVCLSVLVSTNVSLWSRNNLISIECYILNTDQNRKQTCSLAVLCLWIHPNHTCAEKSEIFIFHLSASLTVQKIGKSFQTGNLQFLRKL